MYNIQTLLDNYIFFYSSWYIHIQRSLLFIVVHNKNIIWGISVLDKKVRRFLKKFQIWLIIKFLSSICRNQSIFFPFFCSAKRSSESTKLSNSISPGFLLQLLLKDHHFLPPPTNLTFIFFNQRDLFICVLSISDQATLPYSIKFRYDLRSLKQFFRQHPFLLKKEENYEQIFYKNKVQKTLLTT